MEQPTGAAGAAAATEPLERHQAEAGRLRGEIEGLMQQARLILRGDMGDAAAGRQGGPPRPPGNLKRAEREKELETSLQKINWYRHEIKRLRRELESWDRVGGSPNDARERDPMEVQNLLTEKRKELQRLRRSGEGLDRVAAAQRRAEADQNNMSPRMQERLKRTKDEVEQQKRLNIKLQAERLKVVAAQKKAEEEVRSAGSQLRSKAKQIQKSPKPTDAGAEVALRGLRRDVDILTGALHQDEKKFRSAQREVEQQIEAVRRQVVDLKEGIKTDELTIRDLRAKVCGGIVPDALHRIDAEEAPGCIAELEPLSPNSADQVETALAFAATLRAEVKEANLSPKTFEEPGENDCGLDEPGLASLRKRATGPVDTAKESAASCPAGEAEPEPEAAALETPNAVTFSNNATGLETDRGASALARRAAL